MHDPETYGPNPYDFDPTRFLGENPALDPRDICFGFGRRYVCPCVCNVRNVSVLKAYLQPCVGHVPVSIMVRLSGLFTNFIRAGIHLADASIFIACAMALAVFDIGKVFENGIAIEPKEEFTSGIIKCVFMYVALADTPLNDRLS